MPILIPSQAALAAAFAKASPYNVAKKEPIAPQRSRYQARADLYSAFSVTDDAKDKAQHLSEAAVKEYEKASSSAQAKVGKIELYSPKYYATCTLGGLVACVRSRSNSFRIGH